MCDRALLRDLLLKNPQATPQDLAHEIGRSVSWVKKWRKRLREGDPTDPRLLCSRSRAHHSPYFRLRSACGEPYCRHASLSRLPNLGRTPGPRALLYYLPRDPDPAFCANSIASLQPNESSKSCTSLAVLHPPRGSRSHKIPETPWKRSRWMATGREQCFSSTKSDSRKLKHVIEVCDAGGRRNLCSLVCPGSGRFP
jgi:hypothetical protein